MFTKTTIVEAVTARSNSKPWLKKFTAGRSDRPSEPLIPPLPASPPPLVPPGHLQSAKYWKGLFQGAFRRAEQPKDLHAWLVSGIESGAWKMLRRKDNARFRNFEQFCRAAWPHGLGREPEQVRAFLRDLLGERAAALAVVPPAMHGVAREDKQGSRHGGGIPERTEQRLRAVRERAPEVVRDLYTQGVLELDEAASYGKRKPTPEQQAAAAAFVAAAEPILEALGKTPNPAAVDKAREQVVKLLPVKAEPERAERLAKQFERLSMEEQQRFLDYVGLVRRATAVAAE